MSEQRYHMGRLEQFLDSTLRHELDAALASRDEVFTRASSCHQLRQLLKDIRQLRELDRAEECPGGQHGAEAAKAAVRRLSHQSSPAASSDRGVGTGELRDSSVTNDGAENGGEGLVSEFDSDQRLPTTVMLDLGCHFYVECDVADARVVHVNLGGGVVLPMTHTEADVFLVAKEKLLKAEGERRTKLVLRLRFKMKLVLEAIERLNRQIHGVPIA